MNAIMHSDGGSRGNPGPAAIGIIIEFPDGKKPTIEIAETIGDATNNVAEYQAVLRGLQEAQKHGVTFLQCYLDSELVVKQLTGEYRIRDPRLAIIADEILRVAQRFDDVQWIAVPRAKNAAADRLVNRALNLRAKRKDPRR